MERFWFRTVDRGSGPIFLQLTKGLHVLFVSVLNSHPSSLHLLHYQLLLFKRCRLLLHWCFMLLHHHCTLLCHSSHHRFYRPGDIWCVALRRLRVPMLRCHGIGTQEKQDLDLVRCLLSVGIGSWVAKSRLSRWDDSLRVNWSISTTITTLLFNDSCAETWLDTIVFKWSLRVSTSFDSFVNLISKS